MFISFTTPSEWTDSDKKVIVSTILALVIYGAALSVLPWPLAAAITIAFFYSRATGGIVAKVLAFMKEQCVNFKNAFMEAYEDKQEAK